MKYVKTKDLFRNNVFINFFFDFIMVIFIAALFDKYTICIDKLFKNKYSYQIKNKLISNKVIDISI